MQRTVLVTGGTGFLGSNLLIRLLRDGYRIIVLKRSTSDLIRLRECSDYLVYYDIDRVPLSKVFEENAVDLIIHCATNYGRRLVPPTDIVEANLILPLHLLQIAEKYNVRVFINTDTILDKRVNHYSLSKKQFLDWLDLFSQRLVCINAALEHFYGPMDDPSKFVTRVILDLLNGVEKVDLTPGRQKRDFIYIDDVVDAFVRMIDFGFKANKGFHRFEVGSGHKVEIRDFVQLVKDSVGNKTTKLVFGAIPYRENEVMESNVDISMLNSLGWRPQVTLEEGLLRTIAVERSRGR